MKDRIPDPAAPRPASRALGVAIGALAMVGAIAGAGAQQPPALTDVLPLDTSVTQHAGELTAAFAAATGRRHRLITQGEDGTTTAPLRLVYLPFGPVLITATQVNHPNKTGSGWMSIYYLDQHGPTFTVKRRWPKFIQGWEWGEPPRHWSITDKFTAWPALYVADSITDSGYTCGGAMIAELRPEGPVLSEMITTHVSNEGAQADAETPDGEAPRLLEGRISHIVKGKSFTVRATGTATFTEHYVMRGGRFVRVEKQSRLAC